MKTGARKLGDQKIPLAPSESPLNPDDFVLDEVLEPVLSNPSADKDRETYL
jgi:hypothetical protein